MCRGAGRAVEQQALRQDRLAWNRRAAGPSLQHYRLRMCTGSPRQRCQRHHNRQLRCSHPALPYEPLQSRTIPMTGQPWNRPHSFVRRVTAALGLSATAVLAAGCSSPTKPTPPPPAAPAITCPVAQAVVSADNKPVAVFYPKPSTTGGAAPVTTTCTPDIGASFPLGTSTVTCTATDAQSRTASCAFPVAVQPALKLNASAVLAFGDSITEGKPGSLLGAFEISGVGCPFGTPMSYPSVLNSLSSRSIRRRRYRRRTAGGAARNRSRA